MGNRRRSASYRDIDGLLLLDKPAGMSSNRALQKVRGIYRARKAGHGGSLDPLATGLLPICLGQATKFSTYLLGADKAYRADCRLGQTTTTGDAEGEILDQHPVDVDPDQLQQVLTGFVGEIEQVPPMYSALKHQGKRLYQLAREGKQVEREPRRVRIASLELVSLQQAQLVIDVSCSKGTYIRTLAEDIGTALGCGAHLTALRRTRVEPYALEQAVTLETLEQMAGEGAEAIDRLLLPVAAALAHFPGLQLDPDQCRNIRFGQSVRLGPGTAPGLCRILDPGRDFVGLGEVDGEGVLVPKRLMNTAR